MKWIDFEAHFCTQTVVDYLIKRDCAPNFIKAAMPGSYTLQCTDRVSMLQSEHFLQQILNVGDERIAWMDKNNVDVQILSLSAPSGIDCIDNPDAVELARESNDELLQAIQKYPLRFKGFAAISSVDVKAGVKELERSITQLGFVGWLTYSNLGKGQYLDDKKFWPLLETAESLNVPIFLHPTIPMIPEFEKYGLALAGQAMGCTFETALCLMRMILGGVFDQFPKLKIIMGRLGEAMPFLMERLDFLFKNPGFSPGDCPSLKRLPSQVLRENVYAGNSARFYKPALDFVIEAMTPDHLLFASDYPYVPLQKTMEFIQNAGLSTEVIEKIGFKNAQIFNIT